MDINVNRYPDHSASLHIFAFKSRVDVNIFSIFTIKIIFLKLISTNIIGIQMNNIQVISYSTIYLRPYLE
jgi:hypothetical protein